METNTVIIGSGIAGMTAAIYLKRANVDFILVETSSPGGQILRTSTIENYPGFTSIDGPMFAINVYEQLLNLDVKYCYDKVVRIENQEQKRIVHCEKNTITCQNVIIATGRNPRKLEVAGEEKYIGKGISFCAVCDGGLYKNKNVAVIGGGNSALEEALYLSKICNHVTIIIRSDSSRAEDGLIEGVREEKNITVLTNKQVREFKGNEHIEKIILNDNQELPIDGVFTYIGQIPNTKEYQDLGILDESGYILVNEEMKTKIDHIYACGDCIKKSLYQIITAAADGAKAASEIIKM